MDYGRLNVSQIGDVTVARFKDKKILNVGPVIHQVKCDLFQLIEEGRSSRKILLNFSKVVNVSIDVFAMLVKLQSYFKKRGGMLKLSDIPPDAIKRLKNTELDRVLDIVKDEASALKTF